MEVRFWGTRGGMAAAGPDVVRYGGHTSCVEVLCGEHRIILDAGTGIRNLGDTMPADRAVTADLLLSHFHLDHIMGLAFFAPLYRDRTRLRVHAGAPAAFMQATLASILSPPLMPDMLSTVRAGVEYHGFTAGESLLLHPNLTVRTAPLHHPDGSVGYRLEWHGKSLAYVTDTEHQPGSLDRRVLELAGSADLLIYDSNYTDEEFPSRVGWGHSTWQQAIRLAEAAGVRSLLLFHHDARRTDAEVDAILAAAQRQRPGTGAAAEGMILTL